MRLSLDAYGPSIPTRGHSEEFMRLLRESLVAAIALCMLVAGCCPGFAQEPGQSEPAASAPAQPTAASPSNATQAISVPAAASVAETPTNSPSVEAVPSLAAAPVKKIFTVPAGTKVLLQLRSGINTKSAKPGDGVYLLSTFPVVVGNRVMIPSGVYVQGVVDRVVRAGRVKGKSQLDMHFTSIIFPNGTVVEIPGFVNSLPGARQQSVKDDGEGTIEQGGGKGRNAGEVAKIAIPTGGTVGSIGGLGAGHPVEGGLIGIGAGLAAVGLVSLFTRGADVNIESGTQLEMVLQRPLLLEEENLSGATAAGGSPALVPSASQPKPLEKPGRVLCPPGGLGCQ